MGGVLLSIVTIGLFSYAGWQFVAALVDGEHDGSNATGLFIRLGKIWAALAYIALALQAAGLLLGRFADREQVEAWTATAMRFAIGRGFVTLTGAGIVCFGLYQFYQAYAVQER